MRNKNIIAILTACFVAAGALTASALDIKRPVRPQPDGQLSPVDRMPSPGKKDPDAKPGTTTVLRDLGNDSRTLCRDQGTLIHRVETIKNTLSLTAHGLAMLSVLEADLRALELSVDALYLSAQTAEVIPQARPKIKPIKESLTTARVSIKKARVTMTAITTKTEPIRLKLKTAAAATAKVELGLTAANTIPCDVLPATIGVVKGCLDKMQADQKACVSEKVGRQAGTVDGVIKDYDAAVRVLIYTPGLALPDMSFVNPFNEDLKALKDLRDQITALTARLDTLAGQLGRLNAVLDRSFSFSFPYPDPTITNPIRVSHYTVSIGFRTIIEGAGTIERVIEERLSGFLWGVLKGLGVNSYIESLQKAANSAVNTLLDAVNFNLDVKVPSLAVLDSLKIDEVVLETGLDAFKISVDSINVGRLDRLPGLLNPTGLALDDPDFCVNYNFGCAR